MRQKQAEIVLGGNNEEVLREERRSVVRRMKTCCEKNEEVYYLYNLKMNLEDINLTVVEKLTPDTMPD